MLRDDTRFQLPPLFLFARLHRFAPLLASLRATFPPFCSSTSFSFRLRLPLKSAVQVSLEQENKVSSACL